ncbi:MAG: hypothetical protein QOG28_3130, partial [Trebonia sp.]|nr:hypothetical protein [Trebonia sp.]
RPPAARPRVSAVEHPADRGLTAIKPNKTPVTMRLLDYCGSKVAISAPYDPRSRKQPARSAGKPGHNGRTGRPSWAAARMTRDLSVQRHPEHVRRTGKTRNRRPAGPRHARDGQLQNRRALSAADDQRSPRSRQRGVSRGGRSRRRAGQNGAFAPGDCDCSRLRRRVDVGHGAPGVLPPRCRHLLQPPSVWGWRLGLGDGGD